MHPRFPALVDAFLAEKRQNGSRHEKELYSTDGFTWRNEVSRLIEQRPLVFMGSTDHTILRDGTQLHKSTDEWDRNGTAEQHLNERLTLKDYLSYDEIMLGSLIGVSGPSYFINDGNRHNCGQPGTKGSFEERGVIVGLVGARFERPDRMDSVHILPTVTHPRLSALSRMIENFYNCRKSNTPSFDVPMYQARMKITIDILLLEANGRAVEAGKSAHVYVVGLGLGVWQYIPQQSVHYVECFISALRELKLPNISTLEFAWIKVPRDLAVRVENAAKEQDIRCRFGNRNPAEKLNSDELLVLSYAWDGNAFPGNE